MLDHCFNTDRDSLILTIAFKYEILVICYLKIQRLDLPVKLGIKEKYLAFHLSYILLLLFVMFLYIGYATETGLYK